MNSIFRVRWLASSEVIGQVLFTSEQPKKNKIAFASILSQIKLLFGWLVIHLVWYILKLVYLNGNNAAEGENNIKYANSYPMNWTVKNWFEQDIFESLW